MKQSHKTNWVLAAAVGAVPVLAGGLPAWAQYPSQNDGRARDANNRVGSGGFNAAGSVGTTVSPGNIVYGNVTRGQEFRGPVGSFDARAFRGTTSDVASDSFIRGSSGAAVRGQPNLNRSFDAQPFYGGSRAVAPPPGSISLGTNGSYVTPNAAQGALYTPNAYNNPWGSAQYGSWNTGEGFGSSGDASRFGSTVLGGGGRGDQSGLLLSPLSGIRQLSLSEQDSYLLSQRGAGLEAAPFDRFRADAQRVAALRAEIGSLNPTPNPQNPANQTPGAPDRTNSKESPDGPNPLSKPLGQPFDAPQNDPVQSGRLPSEIGSQAFTGQVQIKEGSRQKVASPVQQSAQYGELQQRLERYRAEQLPPGQIANQQFRRDVQARNAANAAAAAAGQPGAEGAPGVGTLPGGVRPPPGGLLPPGASPAPRPSPTAPGGGLPSLPMPPTGGAGAPAGTGQPAPLEVKSLATGVSTRGLSDLLRSAEEQMRQGKFAVALSQYNLAEQVVPNNSLLWMGKANAELGGASYRSAEAHIRQAFGTDQAVLMGRYDLNTFIGPERLQTVAKDLQELASANPNDAMAPFLLGYVAYNTGKPAEAEAYLKEAEKRIGAPDPIVKLMREHWNLTGGAGASGAGAAPLTQPAANK